MQTCRQVSLTTFSTSVALMTWISQTDWVAPIAWLSRFVTCSTIFFNDFAFSSREKNSNVDVFLWLFLAIFFTQKFPTTLTTDAHSRKVVVRVIVIMAPFLTIFLLVTFIVSSHYSASVLADTQPFELYNSSDTGISILTTANFNSTIFKGKTDNGQLSSGNRIWFVQVKWRLIGWWHVELQCDMVFSFRRSIDWSIDGILDSHNFLWQFYNTWCGHCQHFAPTWKSLANTTLGWSKNFALAVVDCSKRENAPVCNHYSVSSYPSMKFFPPGMKVGADAVSYVGPHTETGVYLGILDYMDKIKFPEEIASVAAKSLSDLWTALPADVEDLALIVEPPDSKLGRAVVLSTAGNIFTPGFTVQRVTTLNAELLQSIGDNLEDAFPRLWLLYRSGKKTRIGQFCFITFFIALYLTYFVSSGLSI